VRGYTLDEPRPRRCVAAHGEHLLGLVHHQRGVGAADRQRGGHGTRRIRARDTARHRPATAAQDRHETGPHERRLPAAGRACDHQHPCRRKAATTGLDIGVTPAERHGVSDVVGLETLVRAALAHRGPPLDW
jgi:hypothetical protein